MLGDMSERTDEREKTKQDRAHAEMPRQANKQRDEAEQEEIPPPEAKDDYEDKYLRLLAETENFKKRLQREKNSISKTFHESFMKDLLPVLDSLDKGLAATEVGETYKKGMQLIAEQFRKILEQHGLEPVPSVGRTFDPSIHQAIQRVEAGEDKVDKVCEEFAKGYLLNGRLLRPSMVSVGIASNKH